MGERVLPLLFPLQESAVPTAAKLFLLPDGSGSSLSYASLPMVSSMLSVYGLNSPHLRAPDGFRSVEETAATWIPEILQVQPHGPYRLGGWSAGGYYAFECAKQLQERHEEVDIIILLDSPCRLVFEALPLEIVRHLASRNLMGNWKTGRAPQWLLDHFRASISAIETYHPTPMTDSASTRVFLIWAAEPVFNDGTAADSGLDLSTKVARFMLAERTDFGANGWEELFPEAGLACAKTAGNHFSIMSPENSDACASVIRDVFMPKLQRVNAWNHVRL